MDPAHKEEARAHVLAKQKPLAPPPAQLESPATDAPPVEKPTTAPSDPQSSGRKKTVASKKRKASSDTSSGRKGSSSSGASSGKKVRSVSWQEMELVDPPSRSGLPFENVESLWYRGLDYGNYLREQLVPPVDMERNVDFMMENGAARLVKSSVVQIVRSAASILATIPTLAKTEDEHAARGPAEVERLKRELESKVGELAAVVAENQRLKECRAGLEAHQKESDELLLKRDEEIKALRSEAERLKASTADKEAGLRKEVEEAEEAAYIMYQQGFDQAIE